MDKASQVLAQGPPSGVPRSYRAIADHSGVPRSTLHHRAHGRRSMEEKAESQQYLTPFEEKAVVDFILQMAELGTPVRIKYIPSIAFSSTRHRPLPDRPLKPPGKNWVKALERRRPELVARRVKAMDWNRHDKNTYEKIEHWFEVIGGILEDPTIMKENVYNMDETGVMLSMLGSVKVLVGKADLRAYRGARVKRKMVTAIECISADGTYLKPMVIWPATTHRSNWTTYDTPGWHYACSESGYTDSKISLEWLVRVFDPQTRERAKGKPRVLICDGFGTHATLEILEHCFANNILLCRLPSHTSHKLQPCDIAVFSPLKVAYRDNVERMERGGVNTIGKQHFTALYSPAREVSFTRRNVLAGWSKGGLFPFDPQRVLREMEKPPNPTQPPTAVAGESTLSVQHVTAPLCTTPLTPVTPVTAEAFMSLRDLIVQQDAHALDDVDQQKLKRHMQKFTKGAQTLIVGGTLKQERIQSLLKANDEAKPRRSTKSIVLSKAKVMSFEDLVEARIKRAEKEANKLAKKKRTRGKKRKGGEPEASIPEAAAEAALMDEAVEAARSPFPVVEIQHVGGLLVSGDRVAPVARMW
jgi:hypothetical protein